MKKENELIVKKHSAMIQTNVKTLTLTQRKVINYLMFIAQKTGKKELYKTTITNIKDMCKIGKTENIDLKEQLKALVNIKIEFNYLNKEKQEVWQIMSLLASAEITPNTGIVEFEFSCKLLDKIFNPSMFAPLNIQLIANLKSSYSIILYEFLRDYIDSPVVPKLTITEFRNLMGIKENEYNRFYDLKNRVLLPSVDEINIKTDINCNYELIKESKNKYSYIKFTAKKKDKVAFKDVQIIEQENIFISNKKETEIPEEILKHLKEEKTEPVLKLIKEHIEKGKNSEYIISNIKYSLKNNIKNFPVYLKKSLEEDYAQHEREKLILAKNKKQRSLEEQIDLEKEYLKLYFPEEYSEKIYSKN